MSVSAAEIAIRVPSTAALFDAWSVEPLATRPLSDEARERIVDAWSEVAKKATGTPRLRLVLPSADRAGADEATIVGAVRADLTAMKVDARHHWIRRALAPRESRIGILIFFAALAAAAVIDFGASEGSLQTLLSQTFVVMAWVALWGPAFRLLTAASFPPRPPLFRRTGGGGDRGAVGLGPAGGCRLAPGRPAPPGLAQGKLSPRG